ncbi:PREDICTED: uncharacterized protein LOC106297775 [Brassica oleracea var. oleracea]|uniref:uncharacterized protein LOC106297775 n=1 Tax=Brassica oleracea var. oleracea TaxID=109376 RepID=UPI0006A6BA95|nr:PREDICTED: uncharacterized protein LOC106297775 [Brassica oleracea var. oleracea]
MGQTSTEGSLDETTLERLIEMIDENNCLAKVFRRARDHYETVGEEFAVKLIPDKGKGKEYDLPGTSEVAGLIVGDMSSTIGERDIVVQFQTDTLQQLRDDHPLYMSLQYPLLFPYGEYGFHPEILLHLETGTSRTRQFLTIREFYAAQIQTRLNQGMTLIKSGRLLHQYIVDIYTEIEEDRLRWARNNQDVLRAELYNNVLDAVSRGDTNAKIIGQRFILPPSFTGGPRYLVEKYHDAMAICREYGNPDLFVTITANLNWSEIKEHLARYGGESPNDRPDIECRVFKMKLDQLLKDFKKGIFFKPYTAAVHRIEFQKGGPPHAHILLWFGNSSRTPSADEVDAIISAELPDKEKDPEAYALVTKHMIHGPCGVMNPKSPCMDKNVCMKKFPRPYNDNTSVDKSGYILYRRHRNENATVVKNGSTLDNNFVVPHNIDLLKKYEAHINVEWCNRTSAVKYLFKYITKGVDRATTVIKKGNTASTSDATASGGSKEGVIKHRNEIQEYIDARYLSACESMWRTSALYIHKRKQSVEKLIIHLEGEHNISVKETDNLGRVIRKPVWSERKRGRAIGRIVAVHPSAGDRYYLRILINKIKGPRSYDELKTYNDVKYPDFKSVSYARRYLDNDVEWLESMRGLWNQELDYDVAEETLRHDMQFNKLNPDQRAIYEAVLDSVDKKDGKLFFVYGAGGTGKTFLYQTIISRIRSRKHIVLPVASSGIAALLLPNGRTAHSRFNIPLKLSEDKLCNIKPGTILAELIEKTNLIIWDEAPMTHKHAFEALDKTLRDIMSKRNPFTKEQTFGGKTVLLGGDFRQILPVVPQGNRADTVLASISHSYLWGSCHKFSLKINMRVNQDENEFSDWLLQVGEGHPHLESGYECDNHHEQMIAVDKSLIRVSGDDSLKEVVDAAYGDISKMTNPQTSYTDKAILTPRNETIDEINAYTILQTDGVSRDYFNSDSFEISDTRSKHNETLYSIEYLNSLEFSGLPSQAHSESWCPGYASTKHK